MSSLQTKKQRLCRTFNLQVSEINNKISALQSVIQDDNISESVLLNLLSKSNLNLETAINMHFKSPSPSLSPKHTHKNIRNSNNSEPLTINNGINNISFTPAINITHKKRKRRFNSNDNDQYTPSNKRRKTVTNNDSNNNNNNSNTNSSMKEERESDDEDIDINNEQKYDRNWNKKILGSLTMDYSVLRRYHKMSEIHHITQGILNGDINIKKYHTINNNMRNKAKLNIYYKQSIQELKRISNKSNIKIIKKQKILISGKSDHDILYEYKQNEIAFKTLVNKRNMDEMKERERLLPIYKKRLENLLPTNTNTNGDINNNVIDSYEVERMLYKEIDALLYKKRKNIKRKEALIDSKYMVEFEVSLFRQNRNEISFEKLNIPYTIGLLSNSKQLLNDINTVLCVRKHFDRRHLKWTDLGGLLDFACQYSYEIHENNNDNSYKHGLNVKLYEYQLQSLDWMIREENNKIGFHRHLYSKGMFKDNTPFFYSTFFQHLIVDNGSGEERIPKAHGGFLCEEMGLGKTIISLALINYNKPKEQDLDKYSTWQTLKIAYKDNKSNKIFYKSRATLIIAPVTLVGQWEKEIDEKNIQNMKYKTYYGGGRTRNIGDYIDNDIVLTTYQIIALESGNDIKKHTLHNIEWHRIILDESHTIRNGNTATAKHIHKLAGVNKWCVTGTPFNTNIKDIADQLKFIGIDKDHIKRLNLESIARKKLFNGAGSFNSAHSCIPIMYLIKMLVMRHKKDQLFNNKPIVQLAGKQEDVIYIEFSKKQREYYNKLYETATQTYNYFKATGNINRGIISILSSLLPSRQACSGHIYNKKEINNKLSIAQTKVFRVQSMVNSNKNKSKKELFEMAACNAYNHCKDGECPICYECPLDTPLQTPCRHIFCGECIKSVLMDKQECPLCREKVEVKQLKKPPKPKKECTDEHEKKEEIKNKDDDNDNGDLIKFDTKLKRLMDEIKRIKRERPNEKSLIFTSFSNSLNWICNELRKNKLEYRTLIGSMSMKKRKKQMEEFANDGNISVFVLTVRTGAVGITLNAANHVFMLEPTMNYALHKQAINRVYRLGQKKKVFIHTLIMKDSIEEKIWKVNKQKYNSINDNANSNMAGNINADKNVKLQKHEISKLFE